MDSSENRQVLIVASKTRAYIKEKGFKASSEVMEELNDKVHELIDKGLVRTEKNKRSTLRAHDL